HLLHLLKRYISNVLETEIAKKIIAGEIYDGSVALIDGVDGKIIVSRK
ncbi:hypothetical protein G6Y96_11650, partial [Clostridium perfringens]|nr:hypothetical protein [Clostridium perfringens]